MRPTPRTFVRRLGQWTSTEKSFNPWEEGTAGSKDRQERLIAHLSCRRPEYMLIGEAPGYQGCRVTGVPFTSEALIYKGEIPRLKPERISATPRPYSEPSSTIVWGELKKHKIEENVILWNVYPFHPHHQGNIVSNRAPLKSEIDETAEIMADILHMYEGIHIIAIGAKAQVRLNGLDLQVDAVRHPSMGGAAEFREGLHAILTKRRRRLNLDGRLAV